MARLSRPLAGLPTTTPATPASSGGLLPLVGFVLLILLGTLAVAVSFMRM